MRKSHSEEQDTLDLLGHAVSISGGVAIVGAWTEEQRLTAPDAETEDRFGHAVAISGDVVAADPKRGRFRAFLLTSFKHFLSKERDKARAQKRGGGRSPLSLDFASGESRYVAGPAETLTPEQLYDRQWTVALLDRVMRQLQEEMRKSGKADWFERLKGFIAGGSDEATYAKTAESLGTTEAAAKMATHRLRKRYRELLRQEIAETIEHVADMDDEIRSLFATFSG